MAALLADVDADAHSFVAVVFDSLDLAAANRDALSKALARFGFGRRGAALTRVIEYVAGNLPENVRRMGEFVAGQDVFRNLNSEAACRRQVGRNAAQGNV